MKEGAGEALGGKGMDAMDAKNYDPEIYALAKHIGWYTTPEELLADVTYFLVFAMARIPEETLAPLFRHYKQEDFINALQNAPAGIFLAEEDWIYWNKKFGIDPIPPRPRYAIMAIAEEIKRKEALDIDGYGGYVG
jgi:hypothetical protein